MALSLRFLPANLSRWHEAIEQEVECTNIHSMLENAGDMILVPPSNLPNRQASKLCEAERERE